MLFSVSSFAVCVLRLCCSRSSAEAFAFFSPAMNSFADVSKFWLTRCPTHDHQNQRIYECP